MSNSAPDFIPGLELSRRFFVQAVEPLLQSYYPGLRYSAGLIGPGRRCWGSTPRCLPIIIGGHG